LNQNLLDLAKRGFIRLGFEDGEPTYTITQEGWEYVKREALTNPDRFAQAVDLICMETAKSWREAFVSLLALTTTLLFGKDDCYEDIRKTIDQEIGELGGF